MGTRMRCEGDIYVPCFFETHPLFAGGPAAGHGAVAAEHYVAISCA